MRGNGALVDGVKPKQHPLYQRWQRMKQRCSNPNTIDASDYHDRGIRVCAEWSNSFASFVRDMGPASPGDQIDRIDNSGGYWCGKCSECVSLSRQSNCRWANAKSQQRNRRRSVFLELNGERKPLMEWAEYLGIPTTVLRQRLQKGMPVEYILLRASEESLRAARADAIRMFVEARESVGLSQRDAALHIGVAETLVATWERDNKPLPAWALLAMQQAPQKSLPRRTA